METTFVYRAHPVIENQNSHGRTHGRRKKRRPQGIYDAPVAVYIRSTQDGKAYRYQAIAYAIIRAGQDALAYAESVMGQRINRSRSPGAGLCAGEHEELGHTGYVPFLNANDYTNRR